MTATVGFQLRLDPDTYVALERVAARGSKTKYIRELIRADLQRRGELKKPAGKGRKP